MRCAWVCSCSPHHLAIGSAFSKVLCKYLRCQQAADRAPPAVIHKNPNKRSYAKVAPEAAWEALEKSRRHHVGLRQTLLVCKDDVVTAGSENQADRYVHKELLMYYNRMQLPFVSGGGIRGWLIL